MRQPTIYEALSERLGRPATNAEASAEVRRLLRKFADERFTVQDGKLRLKWPHQ